jgi:phage shock protein PspC (stress-responsive transcriptional regulator)
MKKVININFQGRVVPIEESAYDILKKYVESLRNFFANEEGRDEIINDIEGRIAELFTETLKKGTTCITDDDVNTIIASIGRPEDFDGEEANVKSQLGGEKKQESENGYSNTSFNQQSYAAYTSESHRKLYRDENNKVLGGICSGLANHFGIDPTIVRILAVIFFGAFFLPYLILWVVIPSTATKVIGSQRKRLYRDTDDKIIAGVCSGLA